MPTKTKILLSKTIFKAPKTYSGGMHANVFGFYTAGF